MCVTFFLLRSSSAPSHVEASVCPSHPAETWYVGTVCNSLIVFKQVWWKTFLKQIADPTCIYFSCNPNNVLPGGPRLHMIRGPPVAPPLPRPPPPPPVGLPPTMHGQMSRETPQPIQHISVAPQVVAWSTVRFCHSFLWGVNDVCVFCVF